MLAYTNTTLKKQQKIGNENFIYLQYKYIKNHNFEKIYLY